MYVWYQESAIHFLENSHTTCSVSCGLRHLNILFKASTWVLMKSYTKFHFGNIVWLYVIVMTRLVFGTLLDFFDTGLSNLKKHVFTVKWLNTFLNECNWRYVCIWQLWLSPAVFSNGLRQSIKYLYFLIIHWFKTFLHSFRYFQEPPQRRPN